MILTEDEAKTKWCPFAMGSVTDSRTGGQIVANRVAVEPRCIASGCMAWRAVTEFFDSRNGEAGRPGKAYPVGVLEEKQGARGYCGLAGDTP